MMQLVTKYYRSELSVHRNGPSVWGEILSRAHRWLARPRRPPETRAAPHSASERGLPLTETAGAGLRGQVRPFPGLVPQTKFKVLYIFHRRFFKYSLSWETQNKGLKIAAILYFKLNVEQLPTIFYLGFAFPPKLPSFWHFPHTLFVTNHQPDLLTDT